MYDIVYVEPPIRTDMVYGNLQNTTGCFPPFGLLFLATRDRQKGLKVAILDCVALGLNYDEAASRIIDLKPISVGITAMTHNIDNANRLAGMIKAKNKDIVIVLGGKHVMSLPKETPSKYPNFDIYHTKDDFIKYMPSLSPMAWDLLEGFPHTYKPHLFYGARLPWMGVMTSLGCNGKCTFCYSGNHHEICRTFSAEYIFDMVTILVKKYGIREISFLDDNMFMYRNNLKKLCGLLIKAKYDLTWNCNARVDRVDEEILQTIKDAGCTTIGYGIEAGNQEQLDLLNKDISIAQVRRAVAITHKIGLRSLGYFMIGKFNETEKTIIDMGKLANSMKLDEFRVAYFTPMPGTKSWTTWKKYGRMKLDYKYMNVFYPAFVPKGITVEQLVYWHKKLLRDFYLRPGIVLGYIKLIKNPFSMFKLLVSFGKHIFLREG